MKESHEKFLKKSLNEILRESLVKFLEFPGRISVGAPKEILGGRPLSLK